MQVAQVPVEGGAGDGPGVGDAVDGDRDVFAADLDGAPGFYAR